MDNMVITGMGIVSNFADSSATLFEALQNGVFAGGAVPMPELKKTKGLVLADDISKKLYGAFCRASADRGLEDDDLPPERAGIILGCPHGALCSLSEFDGTAADKGFKAVFPALASNTGVNVPAARLAILSGFAGINMTFTGGAPASADALAYCAELLRDGRLEAAAVGGVEDVVGMYEEIIKGFDAVPSGGVCVFIAESEKRALSSGAEILAVWRGSAGAYYESPTADDIYEVMKNAAEDSEVGMENIDLIVTSCGYGSVSEQEEAAVRRFGVESIDIKDVTGEVYGAFGAFGAAAAIEMMKRGVLPDGRKPEHISAVMVNNIGADGFMRSFVLGKR